MKKIIALSSIAFLSTAVFANADLEKRLDVLEKKNAYLMKKVSQVNAQAANDNIKFDVDFRTAVDNINYETISGAEFKNDALLSNRLWLNMGYAPTDTMVFKGQLSYHKAYGATAFQADGATPQRGYGFDAFDWISSESLVDDKVRVREAYWLWTPKIGDLGFTVSLGRRPSTNGFLANIREDDPKAKSPLGHVINMEFDGASAGVKLDSLLPGMLFKLCLGRGLTNANAKFTNTQAGANIDYAESTTLGNGQSNLDTVDMAGFIFVPYDDGQYSVKTTWYRGFNVPGMVATNVYDMTNVNAGMGIQGPTYLPDMDNSEMLSTGNMDGAAISVKVSGIGDGISDFLDETTVFASFAWSKTDPHKSNNISIIDAAGINPTQTMAMQGMLGSSESETGNSIWVGAVMPNLTGGKFGLEYNKGSEHWRPFTYGEDTLIGSKLAARGSAYEAYWTQPLIEDVFSMQVRYTYIDYDYTGSNAFFGDGGAPMSMADAKQYNQYLQTIGMGSYDPVESASDLRVYFRYRY